MRLLIARSFALSALMLLAGCDSDNAPLGQAQPATPAGSRVRASRRRSVLESANGMRATLSYKFAGQAAPEAAFTGADGRDVTLADFGGRPLLVNIWATWCAPCKAEMPTLDALAVLEEGRISVIAVSQDLQGRKPVATFFKSAKIENLEPYTDADNALLAAFDNDIALPTTILYDQRWTRGLAGCWWCRVGRCGNGKAAARSRLITSIFGERGLFHFCESAVDSVSGRTTVWRCLGSVQLAVFGLLGFARERRFGRHHRRAKNNACAECQQIDPSYAKYAPRKLSAR